MRQLRHLLRAPGQALRGQAAALPGGGRLPPEEDNAFYVEAGTIRRRDGGRESKLTLRGGGFTFENAQVRLSLSPGWEVGEAVVKEPFEGTLSLKGAAEMAVILKGVGAFAAFSDGRPVGRTPADLDGESGNG